MLALVAQYGKDTPLLVHTDLRVVDEKLSERKPSLIRMLNLNAKRDKLNQLLSQNIVTGCTMMVNRALLQMCQCIPEGAVMHDWWLALIAAAFGHIGFLDEPTVLYRQHGRNEIGAKDAGSLVYIFKQVKERLSVKRSLINTYAQSAAFASLYGEELSTKDLPMVVQFSRIPEYGKLKKLCAIIKYGFWKKGIMRKMGQIAFV